MENKPIKSWIVANSIWIITLIFAVGCFATTIKACSIDLESIKIRVDNVEVRLQNSERCIAKIDVQLEGISQSLKEIKDDLKDIRKIVYQPAWTYNEATNGLKFNSSKN